MNEWRFAVLYSIALTDEELIEVLRQEWLKYYASLDFRHPDYIDWDDFCIQRGSLSTAVRQ